MPCRTCRPRFVARYLALVALVWSAIGPCPMPADEPSPKFKTEVLSGRVVFLAEALQRKFGVQSVDEARQRTLALETTAGDLVPLVEDVRGRGFRVDKRLREMDVELTVRRYVGSPAVQAIRVFELTKSGKLEVDYWCDVCSIVMFELKECECCQEPNVLRKRKIDK